MVATRSALAALAKAPSGGTTFISPDLSTDPTESRAAIRRRGWLTNAGTTTITAAGWHLQHRGERLRKSDYHATATPVTVGGTGQRSFASDSRGTIYFLNNGRGHCRRYGGRPSVLQ